MIFVLGNLNCQENPKIEDCHGQTDLNYMRSYQNDSQISARRFCAGFMTEFVKL
jgi:hypothetical protein